MIWTVRVKLLGRRDGAFVPGIGKSRCVGFFTSWSSAKQAALSWDNDPTFAWSAVATRRKRATGIVGVRVP